ncbi:MAG: tRNA (adenosine(37)-N6)-threonylcarbamoyltransferase complex transferase subunit TsaD [Chlamydiales bacterium]|nr:tRNA (adenosine(37)-N6)-threonylcarbamoyltransferase complex transferase subunit TsaD [Chlamydiales bacterium]
MLVLGIETTCDETAIAVVEDGKKILSNVIYSQTDIHLPYGGVFPELACRKHLDVILPVIDEALDQAHVTLEDIDLIAVANGPGLMGALIIGVNVAKTLGFTLNKPVVGVNHIEAHLYAAMMHEKIEYTLPAIGVVVSGGHTAIVKIKNIGEYERLSTTVDDAIGESFDKVAKMLGLPYPGGPEIEKRALLGNPSAYAFKPGKVKENPLLFSFSGLKTQVMHAIYGKNNHMPSSISIEESKKNDIAASFQLAAFSDIVYKTIFIAQSHGCSDVFLGGGVSNSSKLRELLVSHAPSTFRIHFPPSGLSLDNAAMIAGLGFHEYQKKGNCFDLPPSPKLVFSS